VARPSRHIYVLTLLAALIPLTACASDKETGATEPGDVVAARAGVDTQGAPAGFLLVPSGRLDIRAGKPVADVSEDATTERESRTAPSDGVLVPLTWTYRTGGSELLSHVFGRPQTIEMDLVSDGKHYPLVPPTADRDGEAVDAYYVAVDGDGKQLQLELEYAGVTQTLDLRSGKRTTGLAQGLYDLDLTKLSDKLTTCPSDGWLNEGPLVQSTFTCTSTDTVVAPYVAGEWAPKGSTFVVVGLASALTSFTAYTATGAAATYTIANNKEKSELGGEAPSRVLEEKVLEGAHAGFLVFTVSGKIPKDLVFHRVYTLVRQAVAGDIDAPYSRKVDVVGDLPLR
jgi:hypothetical protein